VSLFIRATDLGFLKLLYSKARFFVFYPLRKIHDANRQLIIAGLAELETIYPMDPALKRAVLRSLESGHGIDPATKKAILAFYDERRINDLKETHDQIVPSKDPIIDKILSTLPKETHDQIVPSKDPIIDKILSTLPEDLQAILEDMRKRWIKKQYPPQKIRYLTIRYLFDMLLGYVKSQIENIWLPKSDSTKEIE
jgi:hypothetical protein